MNASKMTGRWWAVLGVILTGLWLAGCGTPSKPFGDVPASDPGMGQSATNQGTITKSGSSDETIKIGDSLTVVFSDINPQPPAFTDTVRGDGSIKLLMDHSFVAVNKTRSQLEKEIHDFYVPSYYRYMTVTIQPKDQFYWVGGEVKSPNRFQWVGPTTVTRAIQSAADFTDYALKRKVKLYHVDGKIDTVDCVEALKNPALDLPVSPGDTVKVFRRTWPWQ